MNIQSIKFHDQEIQVLEHEGKPYVAMKSICENIGLDWRSQRQRILRNEVLKSTVVMMTTIAKDGKNRELLSLPLGYLNGWLLGIEINRVKPEIRETLKLYQLECYDVLFNHFLPSVAAVYPNTIDAEQQFQLKSLVNEVSRNIGLHYQTIYTRLYERFKIPRYQELMQKDYLPAIDFLSGMTRSGDNKKISRDNKVFIAAILKAGINKNQEIDKAYTMLEGKLSELAQKAHSLREEALEIGRAIRQIKVGDGIIHDAMLEPLIRLQFDKDIIQEADKVAKTLSKNKLLGDAS